MELHELHKRRLEATLQLLEDSLERIEHLLATPRGGSPAKPNAGGLSDEQAERLLAGVGQFRAELRHFAKQFLLQKHPLDLRQSLNAELSSAWVYLENCRPKRMRGYGVPFTAEARANLEEHVEQLLERVLDLRKNVR